MYENWFGIIKEECITNKVLWNKMAIISLFKPQDK